MRPRRPPGGRHAAWATALFVSLTTLAGPVSASAAPAPPSRCARAISVYKKEAPWPQRRFGLERVWPLTTGRGVTVAVLATGVDARHPQFDPGQVLRGTDVTRGKPSGRADRDCDGRGTFAAGLLAARPRADTTFAGVAPEATVLPVRYTGALADGKSSGEVLGLARAVRYAVARKAKVILIPAAEPVDSAELRSAVAAAVAADVVVVAAGDRPERGKGTSYPTSDSKVLAVIAVKSDGAVLDKADRGPYIDVAAPGSGLIGPVADRGHTGPVDSPGMAASFVAGTVALVRAYRPELTATEVLARIKETADLPVQRPDPQTGFGMVNPYAAVTAQAPALTKVPVAAGIGDMQPAVPAGTAGSLRHRRAFATAGALGATAALMMLGALLWRRPLRGGRPTRRATPGRQSRQSGPAPRSM